MDNGATIPITVTAILPKFKPWALISWHQSKNCVELDRFCLLGYMPLFTLVERFLLGPAAQVGTLGLCDISS